MHFRGLQFTSIMLEYTYQKQNKGICKWHMK